MISYGCNSLEYPALHDSFFELEVLFRVRDLVLKVKHSVSLVLVRVRQEQLDVQLLAHLVEQVLHEARHVGGREQPHERLEVRPAEELAREARGRLERAVRRLAEREERTRNELESLDVRLDEAVARVTELGTRAGDVAELDEVAASIGNVVRELEALRLGLDDVEGAA